ncbi:MAG: hypothetical protein HRT44_09030, partial [Bdellovibrionales bacterium]|nr:hypothetical protein [Bdellovibrionales bacterium]NQZ19383.1 hypothetical protein [Bdellovibrionales bacterium]
MDIKIFRVLLSISFSAILMIGCVASVNEPDNDGALIVFSTDGNSDGVISLYDFGIAATGGFSDELIYLINAGDLEASGITSSFVAGSETFEFSGGEYPGVGGTCGESLDVGQSCAIVV